MRKHADPDRIHRTDVPHAQRRPLALASRFDSRKHGPILASLALLAFGYIPLPGPLKAIRGSARSMELNRADREATAGSYYEGLIDGGPGEARSDLARRLMGQAPNWGKFHQIEAHADLAGDFLQFELYPDVDKTAFGARFTTNAFGLRDRPYPVRKAPGVYRIILLGSSIDMGWGISTSQTYENLFEEWLNRRAALLKVPRRFEVLNLAVAAYSPQQRAEQFRRIGACFEPDLVLYSATMLDPRLTELHLYCLLRDGVDLSGYPEIREAIASAGVSPEELKLGDDGELAMRDKVKKKLKPLVWPTIDGALAGLRDECDRIGVPLAYSIIPRTGMSDAPANRADRSAMHKAIAAEYARWTLDLSATFDPVDQAKIEIAPWDDHPNARGHELLFRSLAKSVIEQHELHRAIFGVDPWCRSEGHAMSFTVPVRHLGDLLAHAARHHADRIALGGRSRRALDVRRTRSPGRPRRELAPILGIGPGDRVGLCLRKSRWAVAAIHGILRAGAAYVPTDATGPLSRAA
ncbi:MAG: AMP-binding protein [Isosphaeraceae bacterium]